MKVLPEPPMAHFELNTAPPGGTLKIYGPLYGSQPATMIDALSCLGLISKDTLCIDRGNSKIFWRPSELLGGDRFRCYGRQGNT
jgi:hypothetical protein